MAINYPIWSYGETRLIHSSGSTILDGDDIWNYGENEILHEYVAPDGEELPWYYYAQQ